MKTNFITISSLLLILGACTSPSVSNSPDISLDISPNEVSDSTNTLNTSETPEQNNTNDKTEKIYTISEISEQRGASCFYYEIKNEAKQKIEVTPEFEEALNCPLSTPVLTPDSQKVIYLDSQKNTLYLYDIETQNQIKIMSFFKDTSGINLISWSPDKNKFLIMSVNYNSDSYPSLSKLFVLKFDEKYNFLSKDIYNPKINFSCGSANCSPGQNDIKWTSNTQIQYKTWKDSPYDLSDEESRQSLYIKD